MAACEEEDVTKHRQERRRLGIMINLRRNDEALLAAALTGFTWSCFGLAESRVEDKKEPDH